MLIKILNKFKSATGGIGGTSPCCPPPAPGYVYKIGNKSDKIYKDEKISTEEVAAAVIIGSIIL